ncbi:MAG: hypothetical protein ABWU13_13615 [Limnospira maxima]|uniref:hypothetical protein n=1 Tax=Limnospira sp. Paracas R14 TaxID=2981108 RepID=UPI0028E0DB02|nr:hypothetical protein [Limnospira sp. Paracas R14]
MVNKALLALAIAINISQPSAAGDIRLLGDVPVEEVIIRYLQSCGNISAAPPAIWNFQHYLKILDTRVDVYFVKNQWSPESVTIIGNSAARIGEGISVMMFCPENYDRQGYSPRDEIRRTLEILSNIPSIRATQVSELMVVINAGGGWRK